MWRGELEIEVEDALPFDDVRYAAVKVAPPLRVALVAGQAGSSPYASETYFLETALRLAVPGEVNLDSPFEPKAMAAAENGSLPNLSETQLVVLANVARVSSADAARLAEFVGGGGGLLVFTGDNVEADGYSALAAAGLGPGQIAGPAHATAVPWRLESWDPEHLVFRPFNDPEYGDLRQFAFRAITEVEPAPGAAVLARFRGGRPAVIERRCGRGKSLWFLSACDREWGDWCRSRLYLPLVHQMLAYLAGLAGGGPVRELITERGRRRRRRSAGCRRLRQGLLPRSDEREPARVRDRSLHARGVCRPIPAPTSRRRRDGGRRLEDEARCVRRFETGRDLALAAVVPSAGAGPGEFPRQSDRGVTRRRKP